MSGYYKFYLLSLMILGPVISRGQLRNQFFYDEAGMDTSVVKSLNLGVDITGFVRNNEYFNPIVEGYTLLGYQFRPYLSYIPSENFRVDGGIYLLRDFGGNQFRQVLPYLLMKYSTGKFSLVLGNLEGALTHRLAEPLFDFERVINHRSEEGIQVKWASDRLWLDSWVHWENFIQPGDSAQEIFTAGFSSEFRVFEIDKFSLLFPLQILARHHGGQINVGHAPVYTVYNSALGLRARLISGSSVWFRSFQLEGLYTGYAGDESVTTIPFSKGHGILANLIVENRYFDFYISLWNGQDFYAPLGMPIYQSVSVNYSSDHYTEPGRSLLFFRVFYEKELSETVHLSFRFEPDYDFNNQRWDHSESVFLRINPQWHLLKL